MMILEGSKWEEIYEKEKRLPDEKNYHTDDEIALMKILKTLIPEDPKRFRRWAAECVGVSEETTTGVHRLY